VKRRLSRRPVPWDWFRKKGGKGRETHSIVGLARGRRQKKKGRKRKKKRLARPPRQAPAKFISPSYIDYLREKKKRKKKKERKPPPLPGTEKEGKQLFFGHGGEKQKREEGKQYPPAYLFDVEEVKPKKKRKDQPDRAWDATPFHSLCSIALFPPRKRKGASLHSRQEARGREKVTPLSYDERWGDRIALASADEKEKKKWGKTHPLHFP